MPSFSELPADMRFYSDLSTEREVHLGTLLSMTGKSVDPNRWVPFNSEAQELDFRDAETAYTNTLQFDPETLELGFDLELIKDDKPVVLPQDLSTDAEIVEGASRFYGDGAEDQVKGDPGKYMVTASREGLPYIVNFYVHDGSGREAAHSKNATLLTPDECTILIDYIKKLQPVTF